LLYLIWYVSLGLGIALPVFWGLHWLGWVNRTFREKPAAPKEGKNGAILRFGPLHRWTHTAALCSVYGLIVTGLPLKLARQPAIAEVIRYLVQAEILGILHRAFAVILVLVVLFHVVCLLSGRVGRKRALAGQVHAPRGLLPTAADIKHFREMIRWFAKKGERPKLDQWSYSEKFDYWAFAISLLILAVSGTVLWFPVYFAEFFSGYWFNTAMVVHSYAGLLALGMILLVHILNTSLRRKGFPLNTVMFTGQICEEDDLRVWRSAQYARLVETGALKRLKEPAVTGLKLKIATVATAAVQLLGIGLIIFIVIAIMG
jgi:cytochrome b subunit of formate dehydrogenase